MTSAWSVSLNWYVNPFLLYKVQFERTSFDQRRNPRPAESVAAVRMQLDF